MARQLQLLYHIYSSSTVIPISPSATLYLYSTNYRALCEIVGLHRSTDFLTMPKGRIRRRPADNCS